METGYLWALSYPVICIFVSGIKRGTLFSILFLVILTIILLVPENTLIRMHYNGYMALRIFFSYSLILAVTFIFMYLMKKTLRIWEILFRNLKNEIKSKDEFISKLSHQIQDSAEHIMMLGDLISNTQT